MLDEAMLWLLDYHPRWYWPFAAVERACQLEEVAFEFDSEDVELYLESDDDEKVSD